MRRILTALLAVFGIGFAVAIIIGYQTLSTLRTEPVSGDVYVLRGFGGNVGVLRSERGAVIVDTLTFRMQGERIRERAEEIADVRSSRSSTPTTTPTTPTETPPSPRAPRFSPRSAPESSSSPSTPRTGRANTRPSCPTSGSTAWSSSARARSSSASSRSAPVTPAADIVVHFVDDGVLHLGDLFFHATYPNIDLEAGGSLPAWIETLGRVLEIEFDHAIPGHGEVAGRAEVAQFQAFLSELWGWAERAAAEGWSLEDTLDRVELSEDAGYETLGVPGVYRLDRDFVVRRAWEEATGADPS